MSEFDKGKKRSCCCPCLVTRSSKIIVSVTIVLLVLLGIALSVFYLFPREPKIWIEKPDNEPTFKNVSFITGESNVLSGLLKASVASPFTLLAAFTLKLTAYSPNYIDVYANKIVFDVKLLDADGAEIPSIAAESILTDFTMYSFQNTSVLTNVTLNYNMTSTVTSIASDPVMSVLSTNCIEKSTSLRIRVYVHLDLRVIAWAGVFPTVRTDLTMQCPPLQGSLLSTLFESNKPGLGQTLSTLGATLNGKTDNGAIRSLTSSLPGSPSPDQLGAVVNDALGSELKNLLNGKS